ncbi:MAG: HAD-IIB family hydrolase [Bacteroidales bacterium]|nr:HAD-IIB family hydrolase [Bacteroidales bacterium]
MLKAIFFDIDGTLISLRAHVMPESARAAISRVRAAGVRTFICTSRSSQFLKNVMSMEMDGIVTLAGSHCQTMDLVDIHCQPMDPRDVAEAFAYSRKIGKPVVGMASDTLYVHMPDHPLVDYLFEVGGLSRKDITGNIVEMPDVAPGGVLSEETLNYVESLGIMQVTGFFEPGEEEDRVLSLMPHSHSERWIDTFIDIAGNDGGKGFGLRTMAAHFGILPEECIAVGDGKNDILMLKEAGVAVAMGNAAPELKAVADFVTADVDEDGIFLALKRYFPDLF